MKRTWTKNQTEFLKQHYPEYGAKWCATQLCKKESAVKGKAAYLKLKRSPAYGHHKFTDAELSYLKEHYPNKRTDEIAKALNLKVRSIYCKANTMGLTKSAEFLASPESGIFVKGSTTGREYRYKKGNVPANKGKTMPPEIREKVKHTWFPKGNLPHNTKQDGEIVIRTDSRGNAYKYIRLSLAVWKELHRHNWEQVNGSIPKGMNIVFKDRDSMNCDISNLEMISDADLAVRNSIHRYPEELQQVFRLKGKLKKQIRHAEKQD